MGARVLFIGASGTEQIYYAGLLEGLSIEAVFAASGAEGRSRLRSADFDMIAVDTLLSDIKAYELAKDIKNAGVPMIAIGRQGDWEKTDLKGNGFENLIEKPVRFKMLLAALLLYLPENKKKEIRLLDTVRRIAEEEAAKGDVDIKAKLKLIDRKDYTSGIEYCGGEEEFLSALKIFYSTIRAKSDEIRGAFDNKDWKLYVIKVHALKSSARIVGMRSLSDMAKDLEEAGNEKNYSFINNFTGELLKTYDGFEEKLRPIFSDGQESGENGEAIEDDREPASESTLKDAYSSIYEFCDGMDYDLVNMVLKSLDEYRLSDNDSRLVSNIKIKLEAFDWDGIKALISEVM